MLVVGLTGGIGSGKSSAAGFFQAHGVTVIDADQLSRAVVEPGQTALQTIVDHFGDTILTAAGTLNRARLREIVFDNATERQWLEALLHPLIRNLIQQEIKRCQGPYCILMSPLLLETSQRDDVDRILVVDVPEALQIERTRRRDGNDESLVRAIIATQAGRKLRLELADDVLINDGSLAQLAAEVDRLHTFYTGLAAASNND